MSQPPVNPNQVIDPQKLQAAQYEKACCMSLLTKNDEDLGLYLDLMFGDNYVHQCAKDYTELLNFLANEIVLRRVQPRDATPEGPAYLEACIRARDALCLPEGGAAPGLRITAQDDTGPRQFLPFCPYGDAERFRQICYDPLILELCQARAEAKLIAWKERVEKCARNLEAYNSQGHVDSLTTRLRTWARKAHDIDAMRPEIRNVFTVQQRHTQDRIAEKSFLAARVTFEMLLHLRYRCGQPEGIRFPDEVHLASDFKHLYIGNLLGVESTWMVARNRQNLA